MVHQTLRIQWFGHSWLTKLYKYNGLMARGSANVAYTFVWRRMAHQTVQIHWFDNPWLTKRYIYNGVGTHCSPNLTNTWLWISRPHQTLRIQRFADMAHQTIQTHWFDCQGSRSIRYATVWGRIAHQHLQITLLEGPWLITQYVYNGLGAHGSPNNTNIMVWESVAHQTQHIQ